MKLDQVELRSEVLDIRIIESIGDGSFNHEFDVSRDNGYVLILLEILAGRGDFLVQGFDEENSAAASLRGRQRVYIVRPAEAARRIAVGMFAAVNSKVRATIACFKRKIAVTSGELSGPMSRALSKLLVASALAWMGIPSPDVLNTVGITTTPSAEQMKKLLSSTATIGSSQNELLALVDPDLRSAILDIIEETMWLLAMRDQLHYAACEMVACSQPAN
ncbi:hypothetical protein FHX08_000498 [Rhizobium sp. BK529]|uniref:hypothetical protein n=1 Tax=Rhizobium sp. BK529 TaxID=2586983 RepID=UPI0017EDDDA4|nr:hypothetical protein [Rhizobium sp. BK529]MBB3590154.1 hypothetical protein [Rhizobium sp. BK529]